MVKKSFFLLLVLGNYAFTQASSLVESIQNQYKKPLLLVESLRLEHARNDYNVMLSLCLCFDQPLSKLIKQLRLDIKEVHKSVRGGSLDLQDLLHQLQELCKYLKKHKVIYDAILLHNDIRNTYQTIFDMVDNSQDVISYIDGHRELFGLQEVEDSFLKVFLKKIRFLSHRVSKIEDYVHSDYIDLKLQNYVFKIELLKLRNVILFDKRYKFQK